MTSPDRDLSVVIIRLAKLSDAATLAQLRYNFRSMKNADQEAEDVFIQRCTTWMTKRLQQANWRCWIAQKDNSICGALWLQLIEKVPNPTAEPEFHAYITNVYVSDAQRGQGIGSTLLATALDYCKHSQVHSVILWPSKKSRSLYERNGFSNRSELFELILGRTTLD